MDRCRQLEADFGRWLSDRTKASAREPRSSIRWIFLSPGDDLAGFATRRSGVDVLLGGASEAYRDIASEGRFLPLEPMGKSVLLTLKPPESWSPTDGFRGSRLTPRLLSFSREVLSQGSWKEGYGRIIRLAGGAERTTEKSGTGSTDGAGILAGGAHSDSARLFAAFLVEQREAAVEPSVQTTDPVVDELLSDLLRSTLIDAREELVAAWDALAETDHKEDLLKWMLEPPPWPPASVAKIQARSGGQAMGLVETLAAQIAPELGPRTWLIRSWLSGTRSVDGDLLKELSEAEGGRLAREPRFRAWLRAEWRAWSRQRYRRVARQAKLVSPNTKAPSTSVAQP